MINNKSIASFTELELIKVTEQAAIFAAKLRGKADKHGADQAAVNAMRMELNKLPINGEIVIGEGEKDKAPMLFIGEQVGQTSGIPCDIAVDPLEGTNLCAQNEPNAISIIALADKNTLLNAPDVYMEKIVIGSGYPKDIVSLDNSVTENIANIAKYKNCQNSDICILVLKRPRHERIVEECRKIGAKVKFITDGDIIGAISTTMPAKTGIDMYLGIGGAPEGVITAAILKTIGGQMQARLILDTPEKITRAKNMGITKPDKKYQINDMVKDNVIISATGVTDGKMFKGVSFKKNYIETQTIVYSSVTQTIRTITTTHLIKKYS